jgi:hypothetical protein
MHRLSRQSIVPRELVREQDLRSSIHRKLILFVKWAVFVRFVHAIAQSVEADFPHSIEFGRRGNFGSDVKRVMRLAVVER